MIPPATVQSSIATLREHLDLEVAEFDEHGRYVIEPAAMSEIVDAIDVIEKSRDEQPEGDGE